MLPALWVEDHVPPDDPADWVLYGTAVFLLAMLVIALRSIVTGSNKTKTRLKVLSQKLASLDKDDLRGTRQDALSTPVSSDVEKHAAFLWKEFDETLVPVGRSGRLHNTLEARDAFNTESLAPELIHNRWLNFAPTALTAVGVLGTFAGLVLGLWNLDLGGTEPEAIAELQAGVEQLISGVSVAFLTSVAGVFLSLVVSFTKITASLRSSEQIKTFQKKVDDLFDRHTPEVSLLEIEQSSAGSRDALNELHERIGSQFQVAVEGMSRDMQSAVTEALTSALGPMMQELNSSSQAQVGQALEDLISRFQGAVGQFGTEQAENLQTATAGLAESAADVQASIEKQLQASEQHQAALRAEVQGAVTSTVAAMSEQQTALQTDIAELVTAMREERQHSLTLTEKLSETGRETISSFRVVSSELGESTSQMRSAAEKWQESSQLMDAHRTKFAEDLVRIGENHTESLGMLSELQTSLKRLNERATDTVRSLESSAELAQTSFSSLQEHQDSYLTSLHENVQGLTSQMNQWLKDYSEEVQQQTTSRMDQWNTLSREYAEKMRDIAEAMHETVDSLQTPQLTNGVNGAHPSPSER